MVEGGGCGKGQIERERGEANFEKCADNGKLLYLSRLNKRAV